MLANALKSHNPEFRKITRSHGNYKSSLVPRATAVRNRAHSSLLFHANTVSKNEKSSRVDVVTALVVPARQGLDLGLGQAGNQRCPTSRS
jgi:hypothetical protein